MVERDLRRAKYGNADERNSDSCAHAHLPASMEVSRVDTDAGAYEAVAVGYLLSAGDPMCGGFVRIRRRRRRARCLFGNSKQRRICAAEDADGKNAQDQHEDKRQHQRGLDRRLSVTSSAPGHHGMNRSLAIVVLACSGIVVAGPHGSSAGSVPLASNRTVLAS